ncbi:MAG: hypothetical protein GF311_02150, partial [Candidatus Lokiarchaeota archaeon]|nr:hypothetical protein [Candidatus Lokiarchaeota archaeon]
MSKNLNFDTDSEVFIYEKHLKRILPLLLNDDPLKTLKYLCINLKTSILNEYNVESEKIKNSNEIDNDLSLIWRKIINEHPRYVYNRSFPNILVNGVRKSIDFLGKNNKGSISQIINLLQKYELFIFRRFELYFFDKFPELSKHYLNFYPQKKNYFKNVDSILEY